MSNNYFQFKQFTIHQDKCAMKVSTDACIQGAWTPLSPDTHNALDIGTGTGLLSLMILQKQANITVDAIELDEMAAVQAEENINASPWHNQVNVIKGDILNFNPGKIYDLIICNPPFFQNSLLGPDASRNKARHTLSLAYNDLAKICNDLLSAEGYASILLPYQEYTTWKTLVAAHGMFIKRQLTVKHTAASKPGRIITIISKEPRSTLNESIIIKDAANQYTADFIHLLKDYYFNL